MHLKDFYVVPSPQRASLEHAKLSANSACESKRNALGFPRGIWDLGPVVGRIGPSGSSLIPHWGISHQGALLVEGAISGRHLGVSQYRLNHREEFFDGDGFRDIAVHAGGQATLLVAPQGVCGHGTR